ncbi:RrF2 family transcriptional regulator [soil metagenome]
MRVSAKSDYALRALIEIAKRPGGEHVSAEEVGGLQDIPHGYLQAILADLRKAEILASHRGKFGGWSMRREASTVSVADVLRAVDGPIVSVHGQRPEAVKYPDSAAILQHVWVAARSSLRDILEQVSIQDLVDGALVPDIAERTKDDDAWLPH